MAIINKNKDFLGGKISNNFNYTYQNCTQLLADEFHKRQYDTEDMKGKMYQIGDLLEEKGEKIDNEAATINDWKEIIGYYKGYIKNSTRSDLSINSNTTAFSEDDINDLTDFLDLSRDGNFGRNLENTGCGAACAGFCSTSCYGTCSTDCAYSCSLECGDACMSSCSTECVSSCQTACTATCALDCSGTCGKKCATCGGNCSTHCGGGCAGLTCKSSCSIGCKGGCSSGCGDQCLYTCRGITRAVE